jgi:hypothetical protein
MYYAVSRNLCQRLLHLAGFEFDLESIAFDDSIGISGSLQQKFVTLPEEEVSATRPLAHKIIDESHINIPG